MESRATYSGDSNHAGSTGNVEWRPRSSIRRQRLRPRRLVPVLILQLMAKLWSFTATVTNRDGDSDGNGAVSMLMAARLVRRRRWFRIGHVGQHRDADARDAYGHGGVLGRHGLRNQHGRAGRRPGGQSGDGSDGGDFERESVGVRAVGDVDGDNQRRERAGEAQTDRRNRRM